MQTQAVIVLAMCLPRKTSLATIIAYVAGVIRTDQDHFDPNHRLFFFWICVSDNVFRQQKNQPRSYSNHRCFCGTVHHFGVWRSLDQSVDRT